MKSLVRLTELKLSEIYDVFRISDEIHSGKYNDILKGKSVILCFPNSSIRTRVLFCGAFGK